MNTKFTEEERADLKAQARFVRAYYYWLLSVSYTHLKPDYNNYAKRLVKTPKLYFYDTGLACSLLDIQNCLLLHI